MQYTIISLSSSIAHIQFPGKLNNRNVIWDATIKTLKSIVLPNPKTGIKQYIEITTNDNELKSITIGLNLTVITKPELLKTVIMITNYKNIKLGRHEFGEVYFLNE